MGLVLPEISELIKSCEEADFLPNVLGKHLNDVMRGNMPVVLFGAGLAGAYLAIGLKVHNCGIAAICDNNPDVASRLCQGYPVISVEELGNSHKDSLVIVSAPQQYSAQMHDRLLGTGIPADRIHVPPVEALLYYTSRLNHNDWPTAHLCAYSQQLQDACDLLSDQKSKDIFVHRIALLSNAFDYSSFKHFIANHAELLADPGENLFSSPRYDENYFYFNSDFCPLNDHEVFANVGALVGDCALEFAGACKARGVSYKEIINFEPDPNNFRQLMLNTQHLPNVRCLPYGLWSHRDRLRFSNPDPVNAGTPGSLSNDGAIEVDVAGMDELLPDAEVTFIKMDVEGAEVNALLGAIETIRRNRPKMAISLYHKREDIFEIPLLIHKICPEYKFYIRHHCTTFSETVLFAVPQMKEGGDCNE
jgi:FkbM family methyltransferase